MNQQQPFHLYLLNQKPRKSILKTAASQVGVPKVSKKSATFFKEEQSEPITNQTKTLSFGPNTSTSQHQQQFQEQQQQSESNKPIRSIGFSSQQPSPVIENVTVPQNSFTSSTPITMTSDSHQQASFYYKTAPSLLFQSLIAELPLKSDDVSNQATDDSHSNLSSLIEQQYSNSGYGQAFSSYNMNTTIQNSNTCTDSSSCQPLVFQRMNTASSLLSLFPSIQKETQDTTKMSQQQLGRPVASSSTATSSDNLSHHSLINGGVVGLSNQSNMFKKDYSKAIRQFQNQTTNQFIQRTIASNLDNIQKNRPNIASDRSFLEGMELGMQLNGFLNKLTRDSKDYIKELLDDVSRRTQQGIPSTTTIHNISSPTIIPTTTTSPIAVISPTIDPFVQSSVQNIMQKGQEQAFQTLFVRKCMQEAVSRAIHSSQH